MRETSVPVVIVGASAAGLAVAKALKERGVPFVVLEKESAVAPRWRRRYDRLHLHTSKDASALPGLPFASDVPRYPSRDEVVRYLERYAEYFRIEPAFDREVTSVAREADGWSVAAGGVRYRSHHVVIATGHAGRPVLPRWPGRDDFQRPVVHSARYQNGAPFAGRDVLVVGFGNSGAEIALDLWEHGARPSVSLRSATNVVPRELLGIPILSWSVALGRLPLPAADAIARPLQRVVVGDLSRHGLPAPPYGPMTQVRRYGRIPVVDPGGVVAMIRGGSLPFLPAIDRFGERTVAFVDGTEREFHAVVLATGFTPGVDGFLRGVGEALDAHGRPRASGRPTPCPGLYFCGFRVSPTGMLPAIGRESERIAAHIARISRGRFPAS